MTLSYVSLDLHSFDEIAPEAELAVSLPQLTALTVRVRRALEIEARELRDAILVAYVNGASERVMDLLAAEYRPVIEALESMRSAGRAYATAA